MPNRTYFTTYIVCIVQTAVFTALDQGSKQNTTFVYTDLPTTVGTKHLFTASQHNLRIIKASIQRAELPDIATNKVASVD